MNADDRKILQVFLLGCSYPVLQEQTNSRLTLNECNEHYTGNYLTDRKIIQSMIRNILASGNYTLEGIAYHTRLPLDIVIDAACGHNKHFSLTPWAKIIDLFMQVNPEITDLLLNKLLTLKDQTNLSLILNEK